MSPRIFKYHLILLFLFPVSMLLAQNTPDSETGPAGVISQQLPTPVEAQWGVPLYGPQLFPALPNYIKVYTPKIPIQNESQLTTSGLGMVNQSFQYKDGFNRTFQTVIKNFSKKGANYHDFISVSDNTEQKDKHNFLPFTKKNNTGDSLYKLALGIQQSYYALAYPMEGYTSYSLDKYASTSNTRQTESYNPGKSQVGQNRGLVSVSGTNEAGDVRYWEINNQGWPITTNSYAEDQLFVKTSVRNGKSKAISYTDKDGKVILTKLSDTAASSYTYTSTYNVYDEKGQLRFIVPPKAVRILESNSWALDIDLINGLCFQYLYDDMGKMIAKRNPGEDAFTEFVYDRYERVVMRRSPKEAQANQWEVIFYDTKGRIIASSLFQDNETRQYWQGQMDAAPVSFPTTDNRHYLVENSGIYPSETIPGNTIMSISYYDNYNLIDPVGIIYNSILSHALQSGELLSTPGFETPIRSLRTQGLLTGTKIRNLPAPGMDTAALGDWQHTIHYYDDKGRIIVGYSADLFQGTPIHTQISSTQYDFANRILISKQAHINTRDESGFGWHTEFIRNTYDPVLGFIDQNRT